MSIDKERLDSLVLDKVHEWLEHFDKVQLRLSSQLLIPQMEQALTRGDYARVRSFIERLIELSDKIQNKSSVENLEPSIIRIKCALAAYQMENYNEAIALLEKAIPVDQEGLKGRHLEGTIKCMLGCIQSQLPNQEDSAIISWEESIRIYEELEKLNSGKHVITRSTWYTATLAELRAIVEQALALVDPPASSVSPLETPTSDVHSSSPVGIPAVMSDGDLFRLFRVHNDVSAGDLRVPISESLGYVEINQVLIDGRAHGIVNLRKNGKVVTAVSGKPYEVVRVNGDSMTAEGIDDGDYVLLRVQETAEHNDIVAAQVQSIDTAATLKKFLIERNKFILRFRSNNPKYKRDDGRDMEFQFIGYDREKFQIVGVAIAVFKPLHAAS